VKVLLPVLLALLLPAMRGQTTAASVRAALKPPLQNEQVTAAQLRRYVVRRVPKLVVPSSAKEWTAEARRLRRKALEVAFHGWPQEWIDAPPVFEDLGLVPAGKGYRLRKLRYQIVPGFEGTALLYEPEVWQGKIPAILDVNGHEAEGKALEYIQKRCINQARQGMLALNLEWIGMGELADAENVHWNESYLDLAGANGLGLFYLAMRRGLDYLWAHPGVDQGRVGITGLSGGGWQSIVLGALDERITAALPDAGYRSVKSVGGVEMLGDNEQSATNLISVLDYAHLTAMRAPRPTLLIYNENDNCCFRAPRMKPFLYDAVRPVFALYGAADRFGWYENTDPGDHNYQLDNRLHSYEFFAKAFGLPVPAGESPADAYIKTGQELAVGLPKDNLTILTLARQFAGRIRREPAPAQGSARTQLGQTVCYRPVELEFAWPVENGWGAGMKTVGYRFDFADGLSADGARMRTVTTTDQAPWTLVLDDNGKSAASGAISERLNRGEQVLAMDVLFTGDAAPPKYYYPVYDRMLATVGERSLGMEAAQLTRVAQWLRSQSGHAQGRLEVTGIRSQAVALVAAAMEPDLFSEVVVRQGLHSWSEIFAKPVRYQDAPELFCLDLYKYFDLDGVAALASPTRVTQAQADPPPR
jgi:Acetyl xylan esterase (AXE1)